MELLFLLDILTGIAGMIDFIILIVDTLYYLKNHRRKRTRTALKTFAWLYAASLAAMLLITGKTVAELGVLRTAVYPFIFAFFFATLISAARIDRLRQRWQRRKSGRPDI